MTVHFTRIYSIVQYSHITSVCCVGALPQQYFQCSFLTWPDPCRVCVFMYVVSFINLYCCVYIGGLECEYFYFYTCVHTCAHVYNTYGCTNVRNSHSVQTHINTHTHTHTPICIHTLADKIPTCSRSTPEWIWGQCNVWLPWIRKRRPPIDKRSKGRSFWWLERVLVESTRPTRVRNRDERERVRE